MGAAGDSGVTENIRNLGGRGVPRRDHWVGIRREGVAVHIEASWRAVACPVLRPSHSPSMFAMLSLTLSEPVAHGLSQKAVEIGRPLRLAVSHCRRGPRPGCGSPYREKISDEEIATVNASLVRTLAQLQVKRRRKP
jgi:hypothetical protein